MSKKHPTGIEFLRLENKAARIKAQAKKDKQMLDWYDKNPDHPKTLAFRERAFKEARAKMQFVEYKEAKKASTIKNRIAEGVPFIAGMFELDPQHPSGLKPLYQAAYLEETSTWYARARGKRIAAKHVVSYLTTRQSTTRDTIPNYPRRWLAVKLTYDFDGVMSALLPQDLTEDHYGMPPLAAFETDGGFIALFIQRTGQIIATGRDFNQALKQLEMPARQRRAYQIIWDFTPSAPLIKQPNQETK